MRAAPDFDARPPDGEWVVGVRPHRVGGVRLELAEPLPGPDGPKQLVHNYGHGACGITLSLGCAEEACGYVEEATRRVRRAGQAPSVAVIGLGAVGLATARAVRRRWPSRALTMYAASLDVRSTTSWRAGGQFEPSGMWREYRDRDGRQRLAAWLRASREQLVAERPRWGRLGVLERDRFAFDHEHPALDRYTPDDVIGPPERGHLPFDHLRVPGRRYRTWLINPKRWLPALKAELAASGVRFVRRRFETAADVARLPETVVVDCTGFGARALWGDDAVVAQRGHLVLLERTEDRQDWLFGGGCGRGAITYALCRHDDIAVGGTWGVGDDDPSIRDDDPARFARVRSNGRAVFAGRLEACGR